MFQVGEADPPHAAFHTRHDTPASLGASAQPALPGLPAQPAQLYFRTFCITRPPLTIISLLELYFLCLFPSLIRVVSRRLHCFQPIAQLRSARSWRFCLLVFATSQNLSPPLVKLLLQPASPVIISELAPSSLAGRRLNNSRGQPQWLRPTKVQVRSS